MLNFRTDLAVEELPQSGIEHNEYFHKNIKFIKTTISSEEVSKQLKKPIGNYITIEVPPFSGAVSCCDDEVELIANEIKSLLPSTGLVLVVGLGNESITPDAIGPKTAASILSTRHIGKELAEKSGLGSLRPVATIAPGVLGQTGIETSEIIASIVNDIHPCAVIVVDALASRSLSRLGSTIQISDSGISPGSGVQNKRSELSKDSLGVCVISVGVPTVVDAATLVSDFLGENAHMPDSARSMMVTPRDIDVLVIRSSKILSLAINKALQESLSAEDISFLTEA